MSYIFTKEILIRIIKSSKKSLRIISQESGVPQHTIENWLYTNKVPSIENTIAVLQALGYKLTVEEGL